MPPKRVMRPRSSSSSDDSSSDSDAPMEVSMSTAKQAALQLEQEQQEALNKLAQERKAKAAERAEEQRIVQEKKRRRMVRLEKKATKKALEGEEDDSDDDDDHQLVQIAPVIQSSKVPKAAGDDDDDDDDEFGFNAEDLLAAAAVKKQQHDQKKAFQISAHQDEKKSNTRQLSEQLELQKRIGKLLSASAQPQGDKKLNSQTRKVGRFEVTTSAAPTKRAGIGGTGAPQQSAKDLLAMAHGFTAGTKKKYHTHELIKVPRVHADGDARFSRKGVSNSILDKGHTAKDKIKKQKK